MDKITTRNYKLKLIRIYDLCKKKERGRRVYVYEAVKVPNPGWTSSCDWWKDKVYCFSIVTLGEGVFNIFAKVEDYEQLAELLFDFLKQLKGVKLRKAFLVLILITKHRIFDLRKLSKLARKETLLKVLKAAGFKFREGRLIAEKDSLAYLIAKERLKITQVK